MKKYETLSSSVIFHGRIFDLKDEIVRLPNGREVSRHLVTHPGAVVIAPVMADGSLLLVRQYRHAVRRMLLEFPAGTLEAGEKPLACAQREIAEETGYAADEWIDLGIQFPAPGFCSEQQFCFLAKTLRPHREEGDEDEIIEVERMTRSELERAIREGHVEDAKSVALFARIVLRGLLE